MSPFVSDLKFSVLFFVDVNSMNPFTRLHKTPPMGWSSWNTFSDQINENKVVEIADAIKNLKLDQYGYIYLTVDDLWNLPDRDPETKNFLVNLNRFPNGMKYIGDYLHS